MYVSAALEAAGPPTSAASCRDVQGWSNRMDNKLRGARVAVHAPTHACALASHTNSQAPHLMGAYEAGSTGATVLTPGVCVHLSGQWSYNKDALETPSLVVEGIHRTWHHTLGPSSRSILHRHPCVTGGVTQ